MVSLFQVTYYESVREMRSRNFLVKKFASDINTVHLVSGVTFLWGSA